MISMDRDGSRGTFDFLGIFSFIDELIIDDIYLQSTKRNKSLLGNHHDPMRFVVVYPYYSLYLQGYSSKEL